MTEGKTIKTASEIMALVHQYGREQYSAGKTGKGEVRIPDIRDVIMAALRDNEKFMDELEEALHHLPRKPSPELETGPSDARHDRIMKARIAFERDCMARDSVKHGIDLLFFEVDLLIHQVEELKDAGKSVKKGANHDPK
jgi:hypothetical protein